MEDATGADRIRHRKLSFDVVGCAQKVHRILGPGFPEEVYHKALCYELTDAEIPFESEKRIEVFYNGKPCGDFRADIFVDGRIVLELKAVDRLSENHIAQAISYLKASGVKLAILFNFGTKSLEAKRVVL